MRRRIAKWCRERGLLVAGFMTLWATVSCGGDGMHRGRVPFSFLESSPVSHQGAQARMERVEVAADELQAGDVVAFWMSHDDALSYLRRGVIQKVPYELFQYGHLALVVEAPGQSGELRLLQLAMGQAANVDAGLDYLEDKSWNVFRPPSGTVDQERLKEFVQRVVETASDPKKAYDYAGVLGLKNSPWRPESREEIGNRYSCATLVIAALHYAGYELDAVHRGGRLDVVTPKQVVMSFGEVREGG